MFVKLAEGGHLSTVKYLYDRGSLFAPVNPAFLSAATYGKTNVVEFLLNSGLITAESLDNAFEAATELVGVVHFDTVIFLYKPRRAFLSATNKAHERTSDKAIITALGKATEGEESNINYDTRYQSEIIKLMSEEEGIPTDDLQSVRHCGI
ncbi:hypothetical protein GN958_ATG11998 [Phytophthora infestans]|uniref:Ankyrin repeat protein n=1 Tax=Phytophthora infestans TaxID=4787 RepID=A0A8S9UHR9_PHYIN|nr:hypothetical protein GN958_ATG11998 [Phytophthora infestans]